MTLLKYNHPFATATISQFVDRYFNDAPPQNKVYKFLLDVDFVESEVSYELHAAISGIIKEDFQIEIFKCVLILRGERKFIGEENKKVFKSVETNYISFSRSFSLPDNVDNSKIDAEHTNEILKINISKYENKKLKTSIVVK